MGEGCRGKYNQNLMARFINDVMDHQGGYDSDPELCRIEGQVAEWLAKLRVNLQAVVDLANGCENLWSEVGSPCPGDEGLQSVADPAGIGHSVEVHRYPRASCSRSL